MGTLEYVAALSEIKFNNVHTCNIHDTTLFNSNEWSKVSTQERQQLCDALNALKGTTQVDDKRIVDKLYHA